MICTFCNKSYSHKR